VSVKEPLVDAAVNVMGTLAVLEGCREHRARIVFASTGGALYGEVPEDERATEDWHARPFSPYAASKTAGEHYIRMYGALHAVPWTILRYANVYGPRQSPHGEAGVVAIFFARMLRGEPLAIFGRRAAGDGGCVRDYVYVADVVRANVAAVEGKLPARTLNVGTGVSTTTRQLADRALAIGPKVEIVERAPREGDLERSVLDPTAYTAEIGAPLSLDDGLTSTAAWFRSH
jgi:UDP-glucose 4-epimerase